MNEDGWPEDPGHPDHPWFGPVHMDILTTDIHGLLRIQEQLERNEYPDEYPQLLRARPLEGRMTAAEIDAALEAR